MIHPIKLSLLALMFQASQAPQTTPPPDYILGQDDQLTVTVVGFLQFSGDFLVPPGGVVNFPAVGSVHVAGMTVPSLTRLLTAALAKRIKNPEVTVNLKTLRVEHVSILGDVKNPGVYPIKPGTHLLDVLSIAGALLPGVNPSDYQVNLIRGNEKRTFQLPDVLKGDAATNVVLYPGDTVSLTAADYVPVNVIGLVKTPGMLRLRSDMNGLLEALAQAGGYLDGAALSNVRIRHANGEEISVDLTSALLRGGSTANLPRLQPGDLIIVSQTTGRYAVLGAVEGPGIFPLPEGRVTTLVEAVALARGSDAKDARYRYIGVVRVDNGKPTRTLYDIGKFLKTADVTQNPEIHPGDVIYVPRGLGINAADLFRELAEVAAVSTVLIRK